MPFGKKASQWEEERGDENDIWIKGFRDGETRVRILVEPGDMVTYREHYKEGPGYFPCSEERDCVGCQDDDQKVRQRTRRFAFNALNDRSLQQIYKIGSRVHRQLKSKQQRLGTVCDRDYTVVRSGKNFNEITYDLEPGEKYAIDMKEVGDLYDIGEILQGAYTKAVKAYSGESDEDKPKPKPAEDKPKEKANPAPWTTTEKGEKDEAQAAVEPEQAEEPEAAAPVGVQGTEGHPDPDDLTSAELRAYLDDKNVEYPKNAPASRLRKLASEWQKEHPF